MKINIIAITNSKENFTKEIAEYQKRIKWSLNFKYLKSPTLKDITALKQKEGELLLNKASGFIIALDERGEEFSSPDLSKTISKISQHHTEISVLIGGAFGHSAEVRKKADLILSLSKLTFPHKLITLLLAEQIYRIYSIMNNHPYHK